MWKKSGHHGDEPNQEPPRRAREGRVGTAGTGANIGPSVRIEGELDANEDLGINGHVKGNVNLKGHTLHVGREGTVEATVRARNVIVEGRVQGDLIAAEQILIKYSGNVAGNIAAPRVGLEDGARFKGSIDMGDEKGSASAPGSGTKKDKGEDPRAAKSKSAG